MKIPYLTLLDVRWRVLSGRTSDVEFEALTAVLELFQEKTYIQVFVFYIIPQNVGTCGCLKCSLVEKRTHYPAQTTLQWRHNDHDSVSNHQPHGCLLNRLFGCISKNASKLRVTGLCAGNSPGPVNSPHKGPVTRKMFPFDDVIMNTVVTDDLESQKKTEHQQQLALLSQNIAVSASYGFIQNTQFAKSNFLRN